MQHQLISWIIIFTLITVGTQDGFAAREISKEDILRSLKEQEARLQDLDVCYTTVRQFLKKSNWGVERNKDGEEKEVVLNYSELSTVEIEKLRIYDSYQLLSKGNNLFLEKHSDNGALDISEDVQFSRNSEQAMYLHKTSKHGVVFVDGKHQKISLEAVLPRDFFKKIWGKPITTWIEKGRINRKYQENTINGTDCVVAEYSYDSKVLGGTFLLLRFWLDPSKDFLPVRMVRFRYDSTIREQYDISEYTNVEGVWLPVKGIRQGYTRGKDGQNVLGNTLTMEVDVSSIKINRGIPDDRFKLTFPQGTQVVDRIAGVAYIVGEGSMEAVAKMQDIMAEALFSNKNVQLRPPKVTTKRDQSSIEVQTTPSRHQAVPDDNKNSILAQPGLSNNTGRMWLWVSISILVSVILIASWSLRLLLKKKQS